jgi:hypothetical protein
MFLEIVQLHERTWGQEQYPNRPTLAQLISAPIVALWSGKLNLSSSTRGRSVASLRDQLALESDKFILTCHQTAEELNEMVSDRLLLGRMSESSSRRLSKLFVNQQEREIVGVRLVIAQASETPPTR